MEKRLFRKEFLTTLKIILTSFRVTKSIFFSFFWIFLMILILMGINCVIVDCLMMPYYEFDWLIKSLQDVNTESTLFSFTFCHKLLRIADCFWNICENINVSSLLLMFLVFNMYRTVWKMCFKIVSFSVLEIIVWKNYV